MTRGQFWIAICRVETADAEKEPPPPAKMNAESKVIRRFSVFGGGFLLGIAPFTGIIQLMPGIRPLVLLIPQSLIDLMGPLTAVLSGFAVLICHERESLGFAHLGKALKVWGLLSFPLGLSILMGLQLRGIVLRLPVEGRSAVFSEVVSSQRSESCRCKSLSDFDCVRFLGFEPEAIAECWGSSSVHVNRFVWGLGFVATVTGLQSLLGFLFWSRSAPAPGKVLESTMSTLHQAVFLSYAEEDRPFVERLARDMELQGMSLWWDQKNLGPGDSLTRIIPQAIAKCSWYLVIVSRHSISSAWVHQEIAWAKSREIENGKPVVVPLLLEQSAKMPDSLSDKIWVDFSSYKDGIKRLIEHMAR